MGLGDFKPGSIVAAGGNSLPMGKFSPVIIRILIGYHVENYKTLMFSNEWKKEGDVPHSPQAHTFFAIQGVFIKTPTCALTR